jgi:mRNA interferase MazF
MVMRAQIWLVDFDKPAGSIRQENWPCLIVSPEEMNEHLNTVQVAPMSTAEVPAPFRIPVTFMKKQGQILLDQLYTVDKSRLIRKLGNVTDKTMSETLEVLQEIFTQ